MESATDLLEWFYRMPEPAPRVRTKPMQVLCVGLPRSGTESLQQALLKLGYDYTYHGWDIVYEEPLRAEGWARLAKRKWYGAADGDCHISAAEFDAILGHSVAVTDAAASCFASELIAAYPDAKVVLNLRRDLDAWYRSALGTIVGVEQSWWLWFRCWFTAEDFWSWQVYYRYLWRGLFSCPQGTATEGVVRSGKWIYRDHCNMIRGLVPKERLLEWSVEDGWEPLCKFLGKEVPKEPFPHANAGAGYWSHAMSMIAKRNHRMYRNMAVFCSSIVVGIAVTSWTILA